RRRVWTRRAPSACTVPAARRGPRRCSRASSCCSSEFRTRTSPPAGEVIRLSSADTETTEAAEEQAPAVDEVRQGMLDTLTAQLGDALVESHIEKGDLWLRVRPDGWKRAAEVCRDALACDYFCFLSG